jgi:hypothetical protein
LETCLEGGCGGGFVGGGMVDRGGRGSGGCHGYCGRWGSGAASVSEAECQRMPA